MGLARAVWNGPFYVGPLSPPVTVGDVLLKILETLWRALLLLLVTVAIVALAIFSWVELIVPALFPPLETKISVEAWFDDGSAPSPPAIGTQAGGSAAPAKPFRCTPDYPLNIAFENKSEKTIGHLNFSIEGRPPNRSSNVVEGAAWREADVLIPAGFTWRSCWAVTTRDSFQPSTLNYAVKVWGASEADKDARYQPTTPPRVPAKESPPKPLVGALQSSPSPALSLAALKESDWLKIGMGCSCSFSAGTPQKEKLIAGGDGLTFFRLNGKEHICPAPDTQSMFDGPVSMSCGSAAVQVTPYGKVEPGEDGHSSSARLHIADTSGTLSLTGTWGCGC